MHPEATHPPHTPRHPLLWGAALCVAVLSGCATSAPQPQAAEAIEVAPPAATAEASRTPVPTPPEPTLPELEEPTLPELEEPASPAKDLLRDTLAYADRALDANATTLAREMARLSVPDDTKPARHLWLALLLTQTRQPADTARALGLVQRTLADANAQDLHPLARLLEARLTHQRRLEEQLERQGQQLRDAQRRNDQLSERLEAVRAIERSLQTRPAPAAASPSAPAAGASSPGNGTKP